MKRKNKLAALWTLRPGLSIPMIIVGGLVLVGTAVLITWKVADSSYSAANTGAATLSAPGPTWSSEQFSTIPVAQKPKTTAAPLMNLTLLGEPIGELEQSEESSQQSAGGAAAMSNHVGIHLMAGQSDWPSGPVRWQSDARINTRIVGTENLVQSSRIGGDYEFTFTNSDSEAAQSLLASAANVSPAFSFGHLISHNNSGVDGGIVFLDGPEIMLPGRGVPEASFDFGDVDPLIDIIPKSDDAPAPPAGGSGSGADSGIDPDLNQPRPGGDSLGGRDPNGPVMYSGRDVPEPLTMPILLVGWLLLFRARRNRLDLARVQQLLEESASYKLPPGSSDRTLAQLTASSRRTT